MGRQEEESSGGAPEWMCTFSDLMSLLLCFFILLFALSTIEEKKKVQAEGSLRAAFGGIPAPYIVENIPDKKTKPELSRKAQLQRRKSYAKDELLREEQRKIRSQTLINEMIQVTGTEQGITFRVSGDAMFKPNSYEITEDGYVALQFITEEVKQFPSNPINIAGHTDNTNQSKNPDKNWILAANRAYATMKYLTELGSPYAGQVDPKRIVYESFSEFQPLPDVDENTAIGRSLNRRVEITLVQSDEGNGTFFNNPLEKDPRSTLMQNQSTEED
jgi:chemotaxis protein MotB